MTKQNLTFNRSPKKRTNKKLTPSYLIEKHKMTLEIKRDTKRHKHAAYMRFFRLSGKKSMLESHKIITIHATQKSTFQAVPNVQFNYKSQEEEKEYTTKSPREQLKLVTEASQKCANGNNKKQRPRGYYSSVDTASETTFTL